jgi:hypothetical protein
LEAVAEAASSLARVVRGISHSLSPYFIRSMERQIDELRKRDKELRCGYY